MAETIKGINIKLSLDGKDLKAELNEIKANLKEQQKDLKAINNSLKYDSSNIDLWKQKQASLNAIISETKNKLANQNEQLEKAKDALKVGDISTKEYNTLRRNVQYTEAELNKLNKELDKTNTEIKKLSSINLEKLSKVGGALTKYVTLPIIAAGTALVSLSYQSAQTADELYDQATKLGMSVEALQEWNYTAKILAVDNEQLQKAFVKTNSLLGDLATGNTSTATKALEKLGITYEDLKGKSPDEAFKVIRNALSELEDETTRVGIANDIFGDKIGTELMQLLSAEEEQIDSLIEECNELGVITTEEAEISGAFNDEVDKLKTSLQTLGVEIAMVLLPIMQEIVTKIREDIVPLISSWAEKIANLSEGQKKLAIVLIALIAVLGPTIKLIMTLVPIGKALSTVLSGVGSSGFFAGAGLSAATLGIGALIAILIMALVQCESFQAMLKDIGEIIMQIITPIFDIVTIISDALMPIIELVMELIDALMLILNPLLETALIPLRVVISAISMILSAISPLLNLIANVIEQVFAPVLNILYIFLKPIFDILNAIIECIQWILDHTVGWLLDIVNSVIGWFMGDTSSGNESSTTNNNTTTNNITINTSSSEFDVDSINEALGGEYL